MLTTTAKDKEVSLLLSTKEEKVLRVKKRARADLEKEKEATNEIDGGEDGLGLDEAQLSETKYKMDLEIQKLRRLYSSNNIKYN